MMVSHQLTINFCITILFSCPILASDQQCYNTNDGTSKGKKELSLYDATNFTRECHPEINIQTQQIRLAEGEYQVESGDFNINVEGIIETGKQKDNLFGNNSFLNYELSFNKRFRTGQIVRQGFILEHNLEEGAESESRSEVFLELIQPLLRGRGKQVNTAAEDVAKEIVKAQQEGLSNSVAEQVLQTAIRYFEYMAAMDIRTVRNELVEESSNLQETASIKNNIIDKDKTELKHQLNANISSRKVSLIESEQDLFVAKQQLGIAMGYRTYNDIKTLPNPSKSNFFKIKDKDQIIKLRNDIPKYQCLAQINRAAIKRIGFQLSASERLVEAAGNNLLPELNIVGHLGYTGSDEGESFAGSFDTFSKNVAGLNTIIGATFSYPFGNNAAKGNEEQEKALKKDLEFRRIDLIRNIHSRIAIIVEELINSRSEIEESNQSIDDFTKALIEQKQEYEQNRELTGLIDLLSVQDDKGDVRIDKIRQKLRHLIAVSMLGFETGTILEEGEENMIAHVGLTNLPSDNNLCNQRRNK